MKVLQCFSVTLVLLTAILIIVQELDLNFRGLKIFMHGFQSTKTVKVSSHENLTAYGTLWVKVSSHTIWEHAASSCASIVFTHVSV